MLNTCNRKMLKAMDWPEFTAEIGGNAGITAVWDEDIEVARTAAAACNIGTVLERREDMLGLVDGVLIPDDCTMKHQQSAIPFLEGGIPTFIDKPLSRDLKETEQLLALAEHHGAPVLSCSALRYAKETEDIRGNPQLLGEIITGGAVGIQAEGGLIFYGIHPLELLFSVIGSDIKSVRNSGREGEDFLILTYRDGRIFTVASNAKVKPGFNLHLFGSRGQTLINVTDGNYFYAEMLRAFLGMVTSGKSPIAAGETLKVIKVLVAGEHSGRNGKTVNFTSGG
ncbi:MAG: Gfo/Idh/MocA family oxidoreductase [Victivallaceae bacterium]|nr:Gfo/Idh/MocA family oxidoreductase [Victivallaceae bacterium]